MKTSITTKQKQQTPTTLQISSESMSDCC